MHHVRFIADGKNALLHCSQAWLQNWPDEGTFAQQSVISLYSMCAVLSDTTCSLVTIL